MRLPFLISFLLSTTFAPYSTTSTRTLTLTLKHRAAKADALQIKVAAQREAFLLMKDTLALSSTDLINVLWARTVAARQPSEVTVKLDSFVTVGSY